MTEMDQAQAEQDLLDDAHDFGGPSGDTINEDELLGDEKNPSPTMVERRESVQDDDVDLYDEAVAPSLNISDDNRRKSSNLQQPAQQTFFQQQHSGESTPTLMTTASASSSSSHTGKYNCYIGNLTWWTTDADLHVNIAALGVQDVLDIKFFENRINGQSKGFALCSFSSETSLKTVMEQISNRAIHGVKPAALPYTKQSQAKLEDAAAKTQTRPDQKKKEENCVNMGTIRIGAGPTPQPLMMRNAGPPVQPLMSRAPLPLMINGQPAQMQPLMGQTLAPPGVPVGAGPISLQGIGGPRPLMQTQPMGVPQPLMGSMAVRPPGVYSVQPQPLMGGLRPGMGLPPPGAHVNPNVFPMGGGGVSEAEFEEIMNRNRTVSSSAIQRAISDAHAGDVKAAVETLQTAMNLIKSSRVAHDERCRQLIVQLDDCLRQIDRSGYGSRGSRSSYSRRSRSRDRKRRHRSRSDSRSRSPSRHSRSRHY